MAERKFDPDAVAHFRDFALNELEKLEEIGGACDTMKNGALRKAPAFGTTVEGQSAIVDYQTSHANTWTNLQALRQSLFGIVQALNAALEGHETSEEYHEDDFDSYYNELS